MMKKLLYLFSFAPILAFSQVGIGTTAPQEQLHVAGATSTIRIDGLATGNNAGNLGGTNTYDVRVNSQGNLVIPSTANVSVLLNQVNALTPVNLKTAANSAIASVQLYRRNFTLTKTALVFINYNMAFDAKSYDNSCVLSDGRAKMIYNFYYLGDGTTANTTAKYGLTSQSYTNSAVNTASGYMVNNGCEMHVLAPGTYSVHLNGSVFGGGLDSTAAFSSNFGFQEKLKIVAYYF